MDFSALDSPTALRTLAVSLFALTLGVICIGWPAKVRTDAAKLGWWRLPKFPSAAAHDNFIKACGLALLGLAVFSLFVAFAPISPR